MDIAEVARLTGVPASTLRHYEKKGLIQSYGRKGLRRLFHTDIVQKLALISLGRRAGFSLDEIAEIFTPNGPEIPRERLLAKADTLDRKIRELTALRDGLRHVAACKAPSHFECSKFLRLLKIAGKSRLSPLNSLTDQAAGKKQKP